mmetsp:Transcript_20066/g.24801  ORF Transcript_20066/g.24801 Transcript_20066/m.24801 type:complete len:96 (-) Transcript_20066:261-548(-)|eukprot:CAMPEP_0172481318 /NCGR_PEP_ID=MMETSP1066-20121228/7062_1 /TAXON_ID=671091 /ORGANISM="Coscinodiscus wailesii, Strain CCMP2513" /LENGTH=95 /DNA_ID=CAMNT_0013243465 /DNA_START=105 /DNA_END=392 /DNA_ORIENTATION=+
MVKVTFEPPPYGPGTSLNRPGYGPGVTTPWIVRISKMPQGRVIGAAIGIGCVISALPQLLFEEIPETCKPEYQAASRAYMRYHNMNPITGISKKD